MSTNLELEVVQLPMHNSNVINYHPKVQQYSMIVEIPRAIDRRDRKATIPIHWSATKRKVI